MMPLSDDERSDGLADIATVYPGGGCIPHGADLGTRPNETALAPETRGLDRSRTMEE